MKRYLYLLAAIVLCAIASCESDAPIRTGERRVSLDKGWTFRIDGTPTWREVNLPHDWSVEPETAKGEGASVGPFIKQGGDYQKGHMLGGSGTYKKIFTLDRSNSGEDVILYFEGVYNKADVFVNGRKAGSNDYGYQSFRVDITDCLNPAGEENILEVRCSNQGKNTRWYSGSGIFRHVWLMSLPANHLDEWETQVRTISIGQKEAKIAVIAGGQAVNVTISDASGKVVAKGSSDDAITISDPHLWSPEHPYLYTAEIASETDVMDIRFGIRTVTASRKDGLLINGKPVLLKGGCVHHDHGLLGAASLDMAEERKVQLLKDHGYNAVRCSHNLPSEHFLEACDSIGLLVIDECFDQWFIAKNPDDYHSQFKEHYEDDLSTMIKRDRNHPSVIMWSIGNEIPGRHRDDARAAAARMREIITELDGTRPITAALCDWDDKEMDWTADSQKAAESLDITGYNYLERYYVQDLKAHPDRIIVGTESYPLHAAACWDLVESNKAVIGDFTWTAIDYLGEAGIGHGAFAKDGKEMPFFMDWPYFNGWCGDIDLIGQKKPQSYYRDVIWGNAPITMGVELPCPSGYHREISWWGWQPEVNAWEEPSSFFTEHNLPNIIYDGDRVTPGKKYSFAGKTVHVNVYSRSKVVRLYLNGKKVGEAQTDSLYRAGFDVKYKSGTLKAVNVEDGVEGAAFELSTTGKPDHVRLISDRKSLHADGSSICYITAELVDKEGHVVHDYEHKVTFSLTGEGRILAGGNANPTDMESFRSLSPRLYDGRALVIVQSTEVPGRILVTASSDGFAPASTVILGKPQTPRP